MLTVTDPRGYVVTLTDECWRDHILVQHPIMDRRKGEVRRALEAPDYIYESRVRRSSHLYFREIGTTAAGTLYIMVVVDMRGRARRGFVQTAFIVEGLSKGGKLLWRRT